MKDIKDEAHQHRVTRWIDGELEEHEIKKMLEADPSLKEEVEATKALGDLLRSHIASERRVPLPGMFNHQILRKIEGEGEKSFWSWGSRFFSWMTLSEWGLPVAASAALLALFGIGLHVDTAGHFRSRVVHTFAPNPAHGVETRQNDETALTVITLQGLEPLSETTQVMGYFPTNSSREPLLATTTFYEGEKPPLLLAMNARGEPQLRSLR